MAEVENNKENEVGDTQDSSEPKKKKEGWRKGLAVFFALGTGISFIHMVVDKSLKIEATGNDLYCKVIDCKLQTTIEKKQKCIKIETEFNKKLPHYLIPSVGYSDDFPHWLKLSAENSCNEKISINMDISSGRNVTKVKQDEMDHPLTIPANKTITKYFYPKLDLSKPEPKHIGLKYHIYLHEDKALLAQDHIYTKILEPYMIDWTLEKPNGSSVDLGYIVASLTAWIMKPSPTVIEKTKNCRKDLVESEKEIAVCYKHIFKSKQQYSISNRGVDFPTSDQQIVQPLTKVIQRQGKISALDAGLLLAAAMEGDLFRKSPGLSMVFVPIDANSSSYSLYNKKAIYVVWNFLGNSAWRGVKMQDIETTSFDENVENASIAIKDILNYSNLHKQLNKNGVFIDNDKSVIMIKFRKAYRKHGIQPIPKGDL